MIDISKLDPKQKRKLEKLAKVVDEGELALAEYLFEIEEKIDEEIPSIKDVISRVKGEKGDKGDAGLKGDKGEQGKSVAGPQGPTGSKGEKGDKGVVGTSGKDGESIVGTSGKDGVNGKDGSPDTGKEIVDKINALEIEPELQIGVEHIKDLKKFVKKYAPSNQNITAGIIGRDIIKDIDISAQLDGVTKTFNLPAVWNIISVNLSSFPYGSLRKSIDFTYTPTSITFTSQIDASTQLATGQSCILTVVTG